MPRKKAASKSTSTAQRKPRNAKAPEWTRRPDFVEGYEWDQPRADRVVDFLQEFVTMTTGRKWAGKPMQLMRWQIEDVIQPLYAWVDPVTKLRRYRRAAVFIPKKNGKSTLWAGLVLYHLVADREPGAQCAGAAVDRIQAGLIYRSVAASVRASPDLASRLEVIDSRSTILDRKTNSRYFCLAADSWRSEGIDASFVPIDELHAHRKPDLVRALTYSTAARSQGLVAAISTAGDDRNGIGYEWWRDAELVASNPSANPTFFGKLYAASPDDDFSSPAVWRKANPSLGVTMSEKDFAADYADACTSPVKMAAFLRYRLNVWVESDRRFFHGDAWAKCSSDPLEPFEGRPCWVGVDLASNLDMTSAAFVFKERDGSYAVEWRYWVPEQTVGERIRKDRIPYDAWIRDGWVTVTEGARLDHEHVARDIVAYGETHAIQGVGVDPWQAGALATLLQRAGIEVQTVPQRTATLNAPMKLMEALVVEGRLRHAGNPVAAWNANNLCVYQDPTGLIKPDKAKSTEKIDGMVALVNGLAIASTSDDTGNDLDDWKLIRL